MPELPEIVTYVEALDARVTGATLDEIRVASFSLLKTYDPPAGATHGRPVTAVDRLGKRIVIHLDGGLALVLHLMVAGRLHWHPDRPTIPKRYGLAAFDFSSGSVLLTEAGTKRRASLHVVVDPEGVAALDPGGIEVADATPEAFAAAIRAERHTLKRALTDARFLSGIGGAFADEIMHRAKLSPLAINTSLSDDEVEQLRRAARDVLAEWVEIRRHDVGDGFPERVTAFHPRMAVHGKYGEPCPVCGAPVQRIVYASRETNYCPSCQTGGKILADRSLSRILKADWPRTLDELEGND